jgi:hypothetical protein
VRDWSAAGGTEDRRSALHHFCTAPSGTTTPTSAMSTSVGMNAARYNLLLAVSLIIYIFAYCARSHFVMNFVSVKFLLLFSGLNYSLKWLIFQQSKKGYRPFTSTGFASMLKPNVFYGSNYKRWRQRSILWMTSMHCFLWSNL